MHSLLGEKVDLVAGLVSLQTLIIEVEELLRDEDIPVQHSHEEAFKLVNVLQRNSTN